MKKITIHFVNKDIEEWENKFKGLQSLHSMYEVSFFNNNLYSINSIQKHSPDILIIPATLPGIKSIELIRFILVNDINTKVILLSNIRANPESVITDLYDGYLKASTSNELDIHYEIQSILKKNYQGIIPIDILDARTDRFLVRSNTFSMDGGFGIHKGRTIHELQEVEAPPNTPPSPNKKTNVFVSYSHNDSKYLEKGHLIDYLTGLERHGFEFWYDEKIAVGEQWDDIIKSKINESDIALILVSQFFLNSKYCMVDEVRNFLKLRISKGLVIFPIIVSHCDWEEFDWLASTQFLPRNRKTIERHFMSRGKRAELFLDIYKQLKAFKDLKAGLLKESF